MLLKFFFILLLYNLYTDIKSILIKSLLEKLILIFITNICLPNNHQILRELQSFPYDLFFRIALARDLYELPGL